MQTATVTYRAIIHDAAKLKAAALNADWEFDDPDDLAEMVAWAIDQSKRELCDIGVEVYECESALD